MLIDEAYGEKSATCSGCPTHVVGSRHDYKSLDAFWSALARKGWTKTNFMPLQLGDVYKLWCPECWRKVKELPNYDEDSWWVHSRECTDYGHAKIRRSC